MNRNSYQNYSIGGFSNTKTSFQRSPLYPIGPTLVQTQHKPILSNTYLARQSLQPPSYDQRYLRQTAPQTATYYPTHEQRQRDLISRNQSEIQEEHKRREQIKLSYQREIATKNGTLSRNIQRKQKLQIQYKTLLSTQDQLKQKLMSIKPPVSQNSNLQPWQRKQQEIILLKNKLLSKMRQKQSQLLKKQQDQQNYWQKQIQHKQKIFFKIQTDLNNKRIQINSIRHSIQKPDYVSIQDQIREQKYHDFVSEAAQIDSKTNRLIDQRQRIMAQVSQCLNFKKPIIFNLHHHRQDLQRQKFDMNLRVTDLQRIGRQMEEANKNLTSQLDRKYKMIQKYQQDIDLLKQKKSHQQKNMTNLFNTARQGKAEALIQLQRDITQLQEDLRLQHTTTTRLKTQYQRLYQLLCSSTNKNLHQTFNSINSMQLVS